MISVECRKFLGHPLRTSHDYIQHLACYSISEECKMICALFFIFVQEKAAGSRIPGKVEADGGSRRPSKAQLDGEGEVEEADGEVGARPSVRFDEMLQDAAEEEVEVDLERAWLVKLLFISFNSVGRCDVTLGVLNT